MITVANSRTADARGIAEIILLEGKKRGPIAGQESNAQNDDQPRDGKTGIRGESNREYHHGAQPAANSDSGAAEKHDLVWRKRRNEKDIRRSSFTTE